MQTPTKAPTDVPTKVGYRVVEGEEEVGVRGKANQVVKWRMAENGSCPSKYYAGAPWPTAALALVGDAAPFACALAGGAVIAPHYDADGCPH